MGNIQGNCTHPSIQNYCEHQNIQDYCEYQDIQKSTRYLIRINQLLKGWGDAHVYDFQNNEVGEIFYGKYYKKSAFSEGYDTEECYRYWSKGKLVLINQKQFLETLKNKAVEHIKNKNELIRLYKIHGDWMMYDRDQYLDKERNPIVGHFEKDKELKEVDLIRL